MRKSSLLLWTESQVTRVASKAVRLADGKLLETNQIVSDLVVHVNGKAATTSALMVKSQSKSHHLLNRIEFSINSEQVKSKVNFSVKLNVNSQFNGRSCVFGQ
jgi:hypothetical protein